jgi:methylated-DNA-[protein]-cysteine S-methyltransferase
VKGNKNMIDSTFYLMIPSVFGPFAIIWREFKKNPKVYRIILSNKQASALEIVQNTFPTAGQSSNPIMLDFAQQIQDFLSGQVVEFDLTLLALETCSEFQRRVLLAEYGIPRGWVSTYGRIGKQIGVIQGARAVGSALAGNPFPIAIPCHRAIRSDYKLGGYQGGVEMKAALLKNEGFKISKSGKVITDRFYY